MRTRVSLSIRAVHWRSSVLLGLVDDHAGGVGHGGRHAAEEEAIALLALQLVERGEGFFVARAGAADEDGNGFVEVGRFADSAHDSADERFVDVGEIGPAADDPNGVDRAGVHQRDLRQALDLLGRGIAAVLGEDGGLSAQAGTGRRGPRRSCRRRRPAR